jgi:hypothetical protein
MNAAGPTQQRGSKVMSISELRTELRPRADHASWPSRAVPQTSGRWHADLVVAGAVALVGLLLSFCLWWVLPLAEAIELTAQY